MNAEFDFGLEFEGLDEVDLFLALQLQQQLDLALAVSAADDDNDQPNVAPLTHPSPPPQRPTQHHNGDHAWDHATPEDGHSDTEDEGDAPNLEDGSGPSPTPSNYSLEFSPDAPTIDLPDLWPHSPLPHPSSSEESLLRSPVIPHAGMSTGCRLRPTFSCSICLDDHSEDDVARIPACSHSFCRDCLREYITKKVSEHRYPVFCPICITISESQTPGIISESVIEEIWIPEKEYSIFEDMQLSSLSVRLHCRQCKETMYVVRDEYEANKVVACPLRNCNFQWCTSCQVSVPLGGPTHTCDTDARIVDMVRQNGWKFCPGCKAPIQKESGCNHMAVSPRYSHPSFKVCKLIFSQCITPGCNINFCYSCGDTIIRSALVKEINAATLSHYSVNCRLFEDIPDVDVPP